MPNVPAADPWERRALATVATVSAALALLGFAVSAPTVAEAVEPTMAHRWMAWATPIGVDLAIAAFTGLDLLLVRRGTRVWWLRPVVWLLGAGTIALNTAGQTTTVGIVAHAALPGLWVIGVHAADAAIRQWSAPPKRRDRIRPARWLLAPISTFRMWRRSVLDGTPAVVVRQAPAEVGPGTKAPRRVPPKATPAPPPPPPPVAPPTPRPTLAAVPTPATDDADELEQIARAAAEELRAAGRPVSSRSIATALRSAGRSVSSERAAELARVLRSEVTA